MICEPQKKQQGGWLHLFFLSMKTAAAAAVNEAELIMHIYLDIQEGKIVGRYCIRESIKDFICIYDSFVD